MLFWEVKSRVSQFCFAGSFLELLVHLHEQSPQARWSRDPAGTWDWTHWDFQLKPSPACTEDAESTGRACKRGSRTRGGGVPAGLCKGNACDPVLSGVLICFWDKIGVHRAVGTAPATARAGPSLGGLSVGAQGRLLARWHSGDRCVGWGGGECLALPPALFPQQLRVHGDTFAAPWKAVAGSSPGVEEAREAGGRAGCWWGPDPRRCISLYSKAQETTERPRNAPNRATCAVETPLSHLGARSSVVEPATAKPAGSLAHLS